MIHFSLPVYYTEVFKTKDSKTFLVSLNWYRNAHYHIQNKVKQYFTELIKKEVKDKAPIVTSYSVTYEYYYKNKSSDLPNVTTMTSKWVNDTLQELKLVPNDNVQYLVQELHKVAGQDTINPRIEIVIKEIKWYTL